MSTQIPEDPKAIKTRGIATEAFSNALDKYLNEGSACPLHHALYTAMDQTELDFSVWMDLISFFLPSFQASGRLLRYLELEQKEYNPKGGTGDTRLKKFKASLFSLVARQEEQA